MKSNAGIKDEAILLRKRWKSYREISKELNVSKSTLSYWLKNVPLSPRHKKRLYAKKIKNLVHGAQSIRERRRREVDMIIKKALSEIRTPLARETYGLFGTAIYWSEGTKKGPLEITNSDPLMILFMVHWIKDIFNIDPAQLKARLNIYSQQDEDNIKMFWSELCGIPVKNFGRAFVKPISKNIKKNNLYYGTSRIYVPKSTDMKYKVFGLVEGALKEHQEKLQGIQRKWKILHNVERPVNID